MNNGPAIEAIFWDNDGVLVDTERLYFQASREILADAGIVLDWAHFQDISLRQGQSVFELAREACFAPEQLEQMRLRRNRLYAELLIHDTPVMDGAEETLAQLHGRVPMAIVTSSLREHFDIIHRRTGLLGYFDFILTREDYTHSKPHPEPYLSAVSRSRCSAERCLVVEDSERGLRAATRAHIPCIVLAADPPPEAFTDAKTVISSLRELPSLIA